MGITGLLPFLEKSSKRTNIGEFSGGTVAIDTYCWLHKGVFSCAEKLMMGQTTNAYVLYCTKYINMLLKYNIKPILVFDGRQLPAKKQTEIKRREARQMNRRKAMELIKMGQVAEGKNLLKRAIDISHEIALELIKYCQNENIDCIVAPYEADAQLAYLNISGIADVVITEDSDLTLFGCNKIFFKMDFNGNGVLIEQDRLHLAMNVQPEQFDMDKFRYTCILSGCDYLPSLPGIGLGKAQKFFRRNTDQNIHRALTRVGSVLNMKLVVTQEYRDAFILADITFKHQLVFCPLRRKQVRLNPPTVDITEDQLRYAGEELNAELALQLALGNCDPATLKMMHDFNPDKIERKRKRNMESEQTAMIRASIWSNKYELRTKSYKVLSSESAMNSPINDKREQTVRRNSLKDMFVSSKLHNSPTAQNDKLSERQNLDDSAVLDLYSCQDAKPIASPERKSEQSSLDAENEMSPELLRQKNPFVKRVSDLMTSPSMLSNGNCRIRGRNLMRIRRTVIDENIVVESKYFSKRDDEKRDAFNLENNKIEDFSTKGANRNAVPDVDSIQYVNKDSKVNCEQLKASVSDLAEDANPLKDISDATNRNDHLTDRHENVSEKSCSGDKITETSPTRTADENHVSNNLLTSPSSDILSDDSITDHGSPNANLRENLSKWANTNNRRDSSHKKLDTNFKRPSSENLVLRINSATKRPRQNKSSPTASQQSLLSMYGFKRRPTLKH